MTKDYMEKLLAEDPGLYETLCYYMYIILYNPRYESVVSYKLMKTLDFDFEKVG